MCLCMHIPDKNLRSHYSDDFIDSTMHIYHRTKIYFFPKFILKNKIKLHLSFTALPKHVSSGFKRKKWIYFDLDKRNSHWKMHSSIVHRNYTVLKQFFINQLKEYRGSKLLFRTICHLKLTNLSLLFLTKRMKN